MGIRKPAARPRAQTWPQRRRPSHGGGGHDGICRRRSGPDLHELPPRRHRLPAEWLYERLTSHFSGNQVFKGIESIDLGDDFVEDITTAVESCEVFLALIGHRWLTAADRDGQRRIPRVKCQLPLVTMKSSMACSSRCRTVGKA
jgi:hypothetical protein